MASTTDARCPYCGEELPPIEVTVMGRKWTVGRKPCECDAARCERIERLRMENAEAAAKKAADLDRRVLAAGVPELYLHADHPKAAELAETVAGGTGLYIHGSSGTGKTTLAAAIARRLVSSGLRVEFTTAPKLMDAMRDRKAEDRARTDALVTCRVLVIDDIGMESPTAYASERLHHILSERLGALRPTVYTSNYRRGEIAQRYAGSKAGVAIASRLNERTVAIPVYGEDRRLRNG